jgi:hypothetical protein
LDRGGPPVLAGVRGVRIAGLRGTVNGLARSLGDGNGDPSNISRGAWTIDRREQEIRTLLDRLGVDLA